MIVWVGDFPGHTKFCHNQGIRWDRYLDGLPDVRPMQEIIKDIRDRGIFLLLSKFTEHVEFMLTNIETIFKEIQMLTPNDWFCFIYFDFFIILLFDKIPCNKSDLLKFFRILYCVGLSK